MTLCCRAHPAPQADPGQPPLPDPGTVSCAIRECQAAGQCFPSSRCDRTWRCRPGRPRPRRRHSPDHEGTPVSALQGLEWQHRNDGWCGAGAPRWNVVIQGADGKPYTLQLGCSAAAHTNGDAPNWTRDTYTSATIVSTGASNQGITDPNVIAAIAAGTVQALYIVFDEGTTLSGQPYGSGFVFLDNIVVTIDGVPHRWTSPADNGR